MFQEVTSLLRSVYWLAFYKCSFGNLAVARLRNGEHVPGSEVDG